jgi:translation initiation factor 2B subunit (eIF-2B alpha/beta/delta family)
LPPGTPLLAVDLVEWRGLGRFVESAWMGNVLAECVASLRHDRSHGGSWMARQAVEALAEVANEPAESAPELLERLDQAGRELAASRRAMGGIAGAVGRVLAAAHHEAHLAPHKLRQLVNE